MNTEAEDCYTIVYVSTATAELGEAELMQLLTQARCANLRAGITGLLLYGGGQFVQVIEGERDTVQRLYSRIAADPRHGRLEKLADGPIPRREFRDWSMGFSPPPSGDWQRIAGYRTPAQVVMAGAGCMVQAVLGEFVAASAQQLAF